jgi:mycothiol synthase
MSVAADPELAQLASELPAIEGLGVRRLRLPEDAGALASLSNRAQEADEIDERETAEDWERWLNLANGLDLATGVVVGELEGRMVAYAQARWTDDNDGGRNYGTMGIVEPELRGRGIGGALLRHNERRLRLIAAGHDPRLEKRLESWTYDSETLHISLLESAGYAAVRYFFDMLRPTLDEIPDLPLPPGLEIRPVRPDQHRQIWEADTEAFRDHWGGMDTSEKSFTRHFSGPNFRPELWRVAWEGDEVAGVVMNQILTAYNRESGNRRGLIAGVSVRRPWRGRGLARALVADSLRALREAGMTSAVLGVDAENPTGALGVYEATGFHVDKRGRTFRKPLEG